jgi:hypothetical protein
VQFYSNNANKPPTSTTNTSGYRAISVLDSTQLNVSGGGSSLMNTTQLLTSSNNRPASLGNSNAASATTNRKNSPGKYPLFSYECVCVSILLKYSNTLFV